MKRKSASRGAGWREGNWEDFAPKNKKGKGKVVEREISRLQTN